MHYYLTAFVRSLLLSTFTLSFRYVNNFLLCESSMAAASDLARHVSPHVYIGNPDFLCLWNPESWPLEYGIHLTNGIQNASSIDKKSLIQDRGAYHLRKPTGKKSCAKTRKKKTIKFEVVGERPATMNIQISWTAHVF